MAEIRIRSLDDSIVAALRLRAKQHGRSLEAELRALLTREALGSRRALLDKLDRFRETLRAEYGAFPDSTPMIRAERDRRG